MARKKKVNEEVQQQVTNISYRGNITLTIMHGDRKVKTIKAHNNGLQPLFEYLVHCLAGDFIASKVPSYLRVFNASDVELTYRAIPTTTTIDYVVSSSSASVVLSFNVSSSALRETSNIKKFKIYSRENRDTSSNPSATFDLDNAISITQGSNLVVAWQMSVSN